MSRKNRNKRVRISCVAFTVETITITQQALVIFEHPLQLADQTNDKVQFAEETVQQIKSKLDTMKQPAASAYLTTFDYNEKVIITQALRMYILLLMSIPSNPQRDKELQQCRQIVACLSDRKTPV